MGNRFATPGLSTEASAYSSRDIDKKDGFTQSKRSSQNKKYIVTDNLKIVTNLITPRALFSPTYLLNLVKKELAPFDPPTPKTPS